MDNKLKDKIRKVDDDKNVIIINMKVISDIIDYFKENEVMTKIRFEDIMMVNVGYFTNMDDKDLKILHNIMLDGMDVKPK